MSDHLIIRLQGVCEAQRELAGVLNVENGIKLKKVRLNLQNVGDADSYGQRDFEIVLENPKIHKKLINPKKDVRENLAIRHVSEILEWPFKKMSRVLGSNSAEQLIEYQL